MIPTQFKPGIEAQKCSFSKAVKKKKKRKKGCSTTPLLVFQVWNVRLFSAFSRKFSITWFQPLYYKSTREQSLWQTCARVKFTFNVNTKSWLIHVLVGVQNKTNLKSVHVSLSETLWGSFLCRSQEKPMCDLKCTFEINSQ